MKTFKEHISEQWNIVNVLMSAQQGEAEVQLENGGHITIDEASATRIIMYLQTLSEEDKVVYLESLINNERGFMKGLETASHNVEDA